MLVVINFFGVIISLVIVLWIMMYYKFGVVFGFVFQFLFFMFLEVVSGGGKEMMGSDMGGYYDDGLGILVGVVWLLWEVGVDWELREGSLQRGLLDFWL